MAGKEYKARDKVVNKMTKEGLTEVNLRDGSAREIDGRSRDRPLERNGLSKEEFRDMENDTESVNAAANKKMRIRRCSSLRQKSLEQKENEEIQDPVSEQEFRDEDPIHSERTVSAKIKSRRYQDRLRDHEMIPEGDDLQNGQSSMKKKQKKIQLTKEQAKAGKLSFDDEGNGMIRGSGLGIRKKGSDIAGTVVSDYMRNKVQEDRDDNAAVEGAGALEHSSGRAASVFRQLHNRYRLSKDRSGRKVYREEEIQKESLRFTPDQKEPNVYLVLCQEKVQVKSELLSITLAILYSLFCHMCQLISIFLFIFIWRQVSAMTVYPDSIIERLYILKDQFICMPVIEYFKAV